MTKQALSQIYSISISILEVRKTFLFVHRSKVKGTKKLDVTSDPINIIFFSELLGHFV
ncbi:hypothetical protein [cyanobacterium endosymbiont of Epithemia turgida]|uniref:hypothetical protein n=1 Tax=cyanobacterium endosymbiont of Epithemia turgida TaxID=718217 RepID=UPI0004D0F163|nr:hypothetical protein [cyanobacterium endosymbiont of Epithemia turgida]BAP17866.1 hypothetical protein ETSB_1089 [cyanobacterium endosymbiont of Epithemia turgida isolate EtSB Lake Yunoko]